MKITKAILLTLLSALFVLSAMLLQANVALSCTLFSDSYFASRLDSSIKAQDFSALAAGISSSSPAFKPLGAVSPQWLSKEAPRVAKGLFAYLMGEAKSPPAVDIKPIKSAFVDAYVGQSTAGGSVSIKDFEAMIAQIEMTSGGFLKGGKVNEAAVDQLMQMGQMLGMDVKRDTARKICEKIGNRQKDGSTSEQLYEYTMKAVAADMVTAAGMGDSLDLGTLFATAYGAKSNPVSGFPEMFRGLRRELLLLSVITFALLLLAITAVAFRPRDILGWIGGPLIVAGIVGLALPALTLLLRPQIASLFSGAEGAEPALQLIQNWALSYVGGVTIFLLVQCAVFVLAGVGLMTWARTIERRGEPAHGARKRRQGGSAMFPRVAVAVILLAAVPFSAYLIGRDAWKHVEKYDQTVKAAAKQKNIDFGAALIKAMGVKVK